MKKPKFINLILIFILIFKTSYANELNSQVDQITKNLRCLICQGQSVYDSQSDFAFIAASVIFNPPVK